MIWCYWAVTTSYLLQSHTRTQQAVACLHGIVGMSNTWGPVAVS